jgi:hypothetical protein
MKVLSSKKIEVSLMIHSLKRYLYKAVIIFVSVRYVPDQNILLGITTFTIIETKTVFTFICRTFDRLNFTATAKHSTNSKLFTIYMILDQLRQVQ